MDNSITPKKPESCCAGDSHIGKKTIAPNNSAAPLSEQAANLRTIAAQLSVLKNNPLYADGFIGNLVNETLNIAKHIEELSKAGPAIQGLMLPALVENYQAILSEAKNISDQGKKAVRWSFVGMVIAILFGVIPLLVMKGELSVASTENLPTTEPVNLTAVVYTAITGISKPEQIPAEARKAVDKLELVLKDNRGIAEVEKAYEELLAIMTTIPQCMDQYRAVLCLALAKERIGDSDLAISILDKSEPYFINTEWYEAWLYHRGRLARGGTGNNEPEYWGKIGDWEHVRIYYPGQGRVMLSGNEVKKAILRMQKLVLILNTTPDQSYMVVSEQLKKSGYGNVVYQNVTALGRWQQTWVYHNGAVENLQYANEINSVLSDKMPNLSQILVKDYHQSERERDIRQYFETQQRDIVIVIGVYQPPV